MENLNNVDLKKIELKLKLDELRVRFNFHRKKIIKIKTEMNQLAPKLHPF